MREISKKHIKDVIASQDTDDIEKKTTQKLVSETNERLSGRNSNKEEKVKEVEEDNTETTCTVKKLFQKDKWGIKCPGYNEKETTAKNIYQLCKYISMQVEGKSTVSVPSNENNVEILHQCLQKFCAKTLLEGVLDRVQYTTFQQTLFKVIHKANLHWDLENDRKHCEDSPSLIDFQIRYAEWSCFSKLCQNTSTTTWYPGSEEQGFYWQKNALVKLIPEHVRFTSVMRELIKQKLHSTEDVQQWMEKIFEEVEECEVPREATKTGSRKRICLTQIGWGASGYQGNSNYERKFNRNDYSRHRNDSRYRNDS